MAAGAEIVLAAARREAVVAVMVAGDEVDAATDSLARVAGLGGLAGVTGRARLATSGRVALLGSFWAPPLLLIVTPGATSTVDDDEPVGVDVVPDVVVPDVVVPGVDVGVVPVVPVEVGRLGAGLVPCVELVADLVELVSGDDDELLDDDDEDEEDDGLSAAATPWPVATAVSSHAEPTSPPYRQARAAVLALREIGWCERTCWRVFRRSAREAKTAGPVSVQLGG